MQRMVNAFVGAQKKDMDDYKKALVEFLSNQSDIPFEILAPRLAEFRRSYTGDHFLDWNQFEKTAKETRRTKKDTQL
jgi:hypothetical protein